jgi:hypothetical protein
LASTLIKQQLHAGGSKAGTSSSSQPVSRPKAAGWNPSTGSALVEKAKVGAGLCAAFL